MWHRNEKYRKADMEIHNVTVPDFCRLFGIREHEMPQVCADVIDKKDFRYTYFSEKQRDKIILEFINRMDKKQFTTSGEDQAERWEKGWTEILEKFKASNYDKSALVPPYNRVGWPIRLFGNYVKSLDPNFENNFVEVYRTFLFQTYFQDRDCIYEFGCGSGYNLLAFAEMGPDKIYHGSDWVPQSAQIISLIAENFGYDIRGSTFNMFNPDFDMPVQENSALLTFGSLEQIGKKYHKFLKFLLEKPFGIYIHVNSLLQQYDIENNLTDYLAYRLEKSRNYCDGFFPCLSKLGEEGVIRLEKMHKVTCSGFASDGYSLTVWSKA